MFIIVVCSLSLLFVFVIENIILNDLVKVNHEKSVFYKTVFNEKSVFYMTIKR